MIVYMASTNKSFCDVAYEVGQALANNPKYIEQFPNLAQLIYYPGPDPPSLWTRSNTDCVNCQNKYCGTQNGKYPPPVCPCPPTNSQNYITSEQLDMRRKAEIFKYKKNVSDQTKNQKYSLIAKGINQYKKKCWAAQSQYYTQPNVNGLPQEGFRLACGSDSPRAKSIANCSPTTNNDVPGPIMNICYDETIPLTNYVVRRTYTFNGTKWPQTAWKPGDNGFPLGKAGTSKNQRFLM